MSVDRAAIYQLVADVRALIEAERRRGALRYDDDLELPSADADLADEAPEAPPVAASAAAAPTPPVSAWAALAAASRASAQPSWQTPQGDGAGADGLARIRADLGECERCGLCRGRRSIVFGVGDPDADLMVIGEGPGEREDERGEPFVGPAGEMLDLMLDRVLGLPRSKVYIANVVKCRPPENRNPTPEEAGVCKPFLERQIRAVAPKYLLVLGSVALQHVLGVAGITRRRGQEMAWGDIPAMPTFHPAYLLRQPQDKRLVFEDLKLVRRRYDEVGGRR